MGAWNKSSGRVALVFSYLISLLHGVAECNFYGGGMQDQCLSVAKIRLLRPSSSL